jgi:hypothetical protein
MEFDGNTALNQLHRNQYPDCFHSASGRRGTCTNEEQYKNCHLREGMPQTIICGMISGGSDNRYNVEYRITEKFTHAGESGDESLIDENQTAETQYNQCVEAEFVISEDPLQTAFSCQIEQMEVHTGKKHKNNDNPFSKITAEMSDIITVTGKSACADGSEGVNDGIIPGKTGEMKTENFCNGHNQINQIHFPGSI